mmetsp:Transcript_50251/g.118005  ORF Transcript_50251/g.118005 Transcript_50251/m.118005 type:complete len:161 (+) Transcript_50251:1127-1609(+)
MRTQYQVSEGEFLTFDAMRQVRASFAPPLTHTRPSLLISLPPQAYPPVRSRAPHSQVAQCVGRVIRSKNDYGIMVLADQRYARADKRNKLPPWILDSLSESNWDLSTDVAVSHARTFLRAMAQPHDRTKQIGRTMLTAEMLRTRAQGGEASATEATEAMS